MKVNNLKNKKYLYVIFVHCIFYMLLYLLGISVAFPDSIKYILYDYYEVFVAIYSFIALILHIVIYKINPFTRNKDKYSFIFICSLWYIVEMIVFVFM